MLNDLRFHHSFKKRNKTLKGRTKSQNIEKKSSEKRKKRRVRCGIENFIIHLRVVSYIGFSHLREKCIYSLYIIQAAVHKQLRDRQGGKVLSLLPCKTIN